MAESNLYVECESCQEQIDKSFLDACDAMKCCPQCGSVLAEEQVFNYEMAIAKCAKSSLQGFMTSNTFDSREKQAKLRPNQLTPPERNLKTLVARSCEKLQLSKETTDQIHNFVLSKAYPAFKAMNRKIRLVGACIYVICRNNGLPVTLKQITVATGCSVFELGNVAKMVNIKFGMYQTPVTIDSLIATACSHLPRAKECEDLARKLYCRSSESMVLNGSPLPQAIAHCVLVSLALNKGTNQKQEVAKLCVKMSQVSEWTVLECIRSLKTFMRTLLEAIPWVNMSFVKHSNIHHYVKDIVRYEQNCGKFSAKVAAPKWCHKKELEINTRKSKIEKAMARLHQQQDPTMCKALDEKGNSATIGETSHTFETQSNSSTAETAVVSQNNSVGQSKNCVPVGTTLDKENINQEVSDFIATDLDEEDKLIEELLELGCSPQEVLEGYYENLKTTSSHVDDKIEESEIDSYVRKPEEIDILKRVHELDDTSEQEEGLKVRKNCLSKRKKLNIA